MTTRDEIDLKAALSMYEETGNWKLFSDTLSALSRTSETIREYFYSLLEEIGQQKRNAVKPNPFTMDEVQEIMK